MLYGVFHGELPQPRRDGAAVPGAARAASPKIRGQDWYGEGVLSTKPNRQQPPGVWTHSEPRAGRRLSPLGGGEQPEAACRGGAWCRPAWPSHGPGELRALETRLSKTKADVNRKPRSSKITSSTRRQETLRLARSQGWK